MYRTMYLSVHDTFENNRSIGSVNRVRVSGRVAVRVVTRVRDSDTGYYLGVRDSGIELGVIIRD